MRRTVARLFQSRPIVGIALASGLGVFAGVFGQDRFQIAGWVWLIVALPAVAACVGIALQTRRAKCRPRITGIGCVSDGPDRFPQSNIALGSRLGGARNGLALALTFALMAARGAQAAFAVPEPGGLSGELSGRAVGYCQPSGERYAVLLEGVRFLPEGVSARGGVARSLPGRTRLYLPQALEVARGQRITVAARVRLPDGRRNPGGFDTRAWERMQGVAYRASPLSGEKAAVTGQPSQDITALAQRARRAAESAIDALWPGQTGALMRGLLLGDTSEIDPETLGAFRDTGMAHVLSVSGLHVGFVALLAAWLTRLTGGRLWMRFALCTLLLGGYTLLVGAPAPCVRAMIMCAAVLAGPLWDRNPDALCALALSAVLVLAVRPLDLYSVSFQLSYGAMFGMLCLNLSAPGAPDAPKSAARRVAGSVRGALTVAFAAQMGILLLSAQYFGQVSLISVLLSPAVVLLSGALVIGGLPLVAVAQVSAGIAELPARALDWGARCVLALSTVGSGLPFASLKVSPPGWTLIALGFVAILFASVYFIGSRRARLLALGACALVAIGVAGARQFAMVRRTELVSIDVGQGTSALVRTGGRQYLIDCGGAYSEAYRVASAQSVRLDGVFITHPHEDHFGGLGNVLGRLRVGRIFLPERIEEMDADEGFWQLMDKARAQGIPIQTLSVGDALAVGERAAFTVCSSGFPSADENERGLVLRFVYRSENGERAALFCGDIGTPAERQEALRAQSDLLFVGHHGSNGSSSPEFLGAVRPKLALISAGRNNLYGHPAPEVIARLNAVGAHVERTDESGATTVRFLPDGSVTYFSAE